MDEKTLEALTAHSKECGSRRFKLEHRRDDGVKVSDRYVCEACGCLVSERRRPEEQVTEERRFRKRSA